MTDFCFHIKNFTFSMCIFYREDLISHSQNHYMLLYCFHCDRKTYSQKELQQHLSEHSKYNVLCLYCDKSFLNESEKEAHVFLHHPQKPRKKIRNKHIKNRIHSMWTNSYFWRDQHSIECVTMNLCKPN